MVEAPGGRSPYRVDVTSKAVHKSEYNEEHGVGAGAEGVEDEEEKVFVVSDSDAVVDPGAVVVHFDYAPFADAAVMCPIRFEGVTTATQP